MMQNDASSVAFHCNHPFHLIEDQIKIITYYKY